MSTEKDCAQTHYRESTCGQQLGIASSSRWTSRPRGLAHWYERSNVRSERFVQTPMHFSQFSPTTAEIEMQESSAGLAYSTTVSSISSSDSSLIRILEMSLLPLHRLTLDWTIAMYVYFQTHPVYKMCSIRTKKCIPG
jgi:hypothetical protein